MVAAASTATRTVLLPSPPVRLGWRAHFPRAARPLCPPRRPPLNATACSTPAAIGVSWCACSRLERSPRFRARHFHARGDDDSVDLPARSCLGPRRKCWGTYREPSALAWHQSSGALRGRLSLLFRCCFCVPRVRFPLAARPACRQSGARLEERRARAAGQSMHACAALFRWARGLPGVA